MDGPRRFLAALLLCLSATAHAEPQKFVYAYDAAGALLTPSNSAAQCPDPNGLTSPASTCRGVRVDADGTYTYKLAKDSHTDAGNLILLVAEYEALSNNTYVLLNRKRRVDSIAPRATNSGVDINAVSEAVLRAVEQTNNVPGDNKGGVSDALATLAAALDADVLNEALSNGNADNAPDDADRRRERDIIATNLGKLDASDDEHWVTLASIVLANASDSMIQSTVRKNATQAALDPSLLGESVERVYAHVAGLNASGGNSVLVLDSDKYRARLEETVSLTTARSLNPSNFFAYTWNGAVSEISTATLVQSNEGNYLVCATGELDAGGSTDCVRILVAEPTEAIAGASTYRVGVGGIIRVSGAASVNAKTYQWSGSGFFSDTTTAEAAWKAPSTPGTYELTLIVNTEDSATLSIEVYDVLPVALAKAEPSTATLSNGAASFMLTSLATTTDGSALDALAWSVVSQPVGGTPSLSSATAAATTLTVNAAGTYVVELLATRAGRTDSTELTVYAVAPGAVFAKAGADQFTYRNTAVKLDGSKSWAQSGKSLAYSWTSGGGTLSSPASSGTNFTSATVGVFPVTLQVSDGDSSATDAVNVTVRNRTPLASDDTFKQRPNKVLNGQLRGSDGDGDDVDYVLVTEPSNGGLTLNTETGAFVYVPGGAKNCHYTPGMAPLDVSAAQDVPVLKLCADRYIVAPGDPVTLNVSHSINASKFSGYFWKNAKGDPTNITRAFFSATKEGTYTVCVTGNVGQSKNTSTACTDLIVGDNPGNTDGDDPTSYTDRFDFKVNDGIDDSHTATATIVVTWENATPVPQAQNVTTAEETAISGTLTATDEENNSITFALSAQGTKGTATVASNGAFTYTPAKDKVGTDTFKFTAADAYHASLSATVTVTITNVNDAPVGTFTKTLAVTEDSSAADTLTGTDIDGDTLTYQLITQATRGTVTITNPATGAFSYVPNANVSGSDHFFYAAHDGTLESPSVKVNITIANVNDAPVAADMGPLSTNADTVLSGKLTVTDVDNDALLYSIVTQPARGTLALNAGKGTFTYTPKSLTNLGADSFTFKASDASSTSNTAKVDITVLAVNHAPVATAQSISVMEGVAFSGALTGSDSDAQAITYAIATNGALGTAEIPSANSGAFTYTPSAGKSGQDFFTFKVSDGEKTSSSATVNVAITPLATLCNGPGSAKQDADADGYADYVEREFGTQTASSASTPFGLDPVALGVSYSNDDDSDGYVDHPELWLKTDPRSAASKPSASTTKLLPDCFASARDTAAPTLHALKVITPSLDAATGTAAPKFAFTALDNASGVAKIVIRLTSPSGIEHKTTHTANDKPLVLAMQITGAALSGYAEAGTWNIADVTITDGAGQVLKLTKADLQSRGYPYSLTVTNTNADASAPTVSNFEVLTPALDVSNAAAAASFRVTTADNKAGIKRVAVALRSPNGVYRWGEVNRSDNQTSLVATINTQVLEPFVEPGTWTVTELSVTDQAGNVHKLDNAGIVAKGWPATVVVTTTVPDTAAPALTSFQILTPTIDPTPGGVSAAYALSLTDNNSGIGDIVVVLTGPSGELILGNHHANTPSAALTVNVTSETFGATAQAGTWTVTSLLATDAAGNIKNWSTANLTSLGFATTITVTVPSSGGGIGTGKRNKAPVAIASSLSTSEDVAVNGVLRATDADGDTLIYSVISNGSKGAVVITNTATGAYTYTPNANANGFDSFSFRVDDGVAASNVATVSVEVTPVADPTVAQDGTATVTVGSGVIGSLIATDADGEALTYTLVAQGTKGSVVSLDATLGTYQYAPNPNQSGTDTFTFKAGDGNSTSNIATITVSIVPEISVTGFEIKTPVISSKDASVTVTTAVTLSKPIADIAEIRLSMRGPTGVVYGFAAVVNGAAWPATVTRTFTTASEPIAAGTWTFINLLAKRDGDTISKTVAENIGAAGFADTLTALANTSPTATAASYATTLGTLKSGTLAATDPEGDSVTFAISKQPTKGTVILSDAGTGAFVYTPTATGNDSFQFTASDGKTTSAPATVTLTVTATNNAPVAYGASLAVTKNEAYVGTLTASDPNGNALVYTIVTAPAKGTVNFTNTATGAFVYFPNSNTTGSDSFTFKANDGTADSNVATVNVTIAAANAAPVATAQSIVAFKNVSYSGSLSGTNPEGSSLTYAVSTAPAHGTLSLTAASGAFIYTPSSNYTGADSFAFKVKDGVNTSAAASVSIDVIGTEQACGAGGIDADADSDSDGYADDIETAMGSDKNAAASVPANVNAVAPNYTFKGDTDLDGVVDHVETWLHTQPTNASSKPKAVLSTCFDGASDGIKPRLLGFDIITENVDAGAGATTSSYALSVSDNASGVKRVRVSLSSPSGTFVTHATSFGDYPVQRALRMDVTAFGTYSDAGTWTVTGVTIFDEAGNRLDLSTDDLQDAGFPVGITVTNNTADNTAPSLTGFTILTPSVDASTGTATFSVNVSASDAGAGLASMRVDFISTSGTIVSAVKTLSGAPASSTTQLDSATLSAFLEQGTWTVFGVLLVDNAGNSAQFASTLAASGYANTLTVTNANSDAVAPQLVSITVLSPTVTPSTGVARMSFGVSATDNLSGVEKVRIDLTGPSGQFMTLWGTYSSTHPTTLTAQIDSAVLSTLLETGTWTIDAVDVYDNAGNHSILYTDELTGLGLPTTVLVQ